MPRPIESLSVPDREAGVTALVDWLEYAALLETRKEVLIGRLVDQLDLDIDRDRDEVNAADEYREDQFSIIAAEIRRRRAALGATYPFRLSPNNQRLVRSKTITLPQSVYMLCLVLCHSIDNIIVPAEMQPKKTKLQAARNLFQICATAAAAGHVRGPSFSIGWPRIDNTTFHQKLTKVWKYFKDGQVVTVVPASVPKSVKDDGIDVLAFWTEADGGTSFGYLVGQAASGKDWENKSAEPALKMLVNEWFERTPAAPGHTATFIPFCLEGDLDRWRRHTLNHRYVLPRTRLSKFVADAMLLRKQGVKPIERLNELKNVKKWVEDYVKFARAVSA